MTSFDKISYISVFLFSIIFSNFQRKIRDKAPKTVFKKIQKQKIIIITINFRDQLCNYLYKSLKIFRNHAIINLFWDLLISFHYRILHSPDFLSLIRMKKCENMRRKLKIEEEKVNLYEQTWRIKKRNKWRISQFSECYKNSKIN